MKRRIAIIMVLSMLLCGCSDTKSGTENVAEKKVSSATTAQTGSAENETATVEMSADSENIAASQAASGENGNSEASGENTRNIPWFSPSVYEGRIDGVTKVKYTFDDLSSGTATDLENGTTTKFKCEQVKDKILFTFEGDNDTTAMTMATDGKGNIVGTINGVTYVFVDPEIEASYNDSSLEANSDPYVGVYYEEHAQRGSISVDLNGDTYTVYIRWAGSAATASEWTFSGQFNGRAVLYYDNCVKNNITYAEDGTPTYEQVYTNGSGYIQISESGGAPGLVWADSMENAGAEAFFAKG